VTDELYHSSPKLVVVGSRIYYLAGLTTRSWIWWNQACVH